MQIEVESQMSAMARNGVREYQPTFRGQQLEAESGRSVASENNLTTLLKSGLRVAAINVVEGGCILVVFKTGETYLATGMRVGQPQDKPETVALAKFLAKVFHHKVEPWLPVVSGQLHEGYRGPIVADELPGKVGPRIFNAE